MDDLVISILLICVYVVVVGGGYLYDIIKKQVKRHKKARKVVDSVNFEIEEENRQATLKKNKSEEKKEQTEITDTDQTNVEKKTEESKKKED